ncbi:7-carboxy-7-deazaguanine synthase QueE [bacterium]|nr:7-carboxy-7-deazaguanine synthase QueE [bacterium]
MDKLVLVGEGVFPITKNSAGELIKGGPQTGFNVSGTIQGEGKWAGTASLFIRLAGCNLRCIWQMEDGSFSRCDTAYASFHPDSPTDYSIEEITNIVKANIGNMQHVVITGGEPLLQKYGVIALCKEIKKLGLYITIETNGTIFDKELTQYIDLVSASPKLSNSEPSENKMAFFREEFNGTAIHHAERRRNLSALQSYIDYCNQNNTELQLKFVVGRSKDAEEIRSDYVQSLNGLRQEDILIMPLGANMAEIHCSERLALQVCIQNGWRYSPRVHIELFGSKQGV